MVFFPAYGAPVDGGAAWEIEIHGWVFEPGWPVETVWNEFRAAMGLPPLPAAENESYAIFRERAKPFLVDNERDKRIVVRIGETHYPLAPSAPNGHFYGRVRLAAEDVKKLQDAAPIKGGPVSFQAALAKSDPRVFAGEIQLIPDADIGVISDIDDTIKISAVRNKQALLTNTFLRPFQAVPGMAALYQQWAKRPGVSFHYVSASPWQLYAALEEFRRQAGFPAGLYELKLFRWKDESFFNLFASPEAYKRPILEGLLKQWPRRQFTLLGDSGESDPEIYGDLARRHPGRIVRIWIRNVTGEAADHPRYQQAFRDLPVGLWNVFQEPAEITDTWP